MKKPPMAREDPRGQSLMHLLDFAVHGFLQQAIMKLGLLVRNRTPVILFGAFEELGFAQKGQYKIIEKTQIEWMPDLEEL
jgi:hypothetical protein